MRFKVLIFFLFITLFGKAQTGVFYTVKNLTYSNGKVSAINALGKTIFQVNCKDMIYYQQQDLTIGVFDYQTVTSRIFINSQITSPAYSVVIDSLKSWQMACAGSGTPLPIPLIVNNVGIDTVKVADSVRVWFNQNLDTSNQGILKSIFGILRDSLDKNVYINNDSLRVYFNSPPQISDTANKAVLLSIHNLLKDSLDKNIYINNDSLRVYFKDLPFVSDTANQSVLNAIHNLLRDSLDKQLYIQNDSLKVWFSQPIEVKTDTANSAVLNAILQTLVDSLDKTIYVLNDSLRVYFNQVPQISDTANNAILNAIYNTLVDSLDKQLYVLNPYIDSAIVRRMDTIIDRLTTTEKLDTLKGLVYTAIAKVRTNRDTLFNCKSLSFGRKSGASGTLVLTYENGESESFDVANDDLPTWVNGEFISYIDYNATGAVGLIVNTLGCSQTSTEICAKVKPIFDCELVVPITCNGWQSASGVWQTASGCWNTGQ